MSSKGVDGFGFRDRRSRSLLSERFGAGFGEAAGVAVEKPLCPGSELRVEGKQVAGKQLEAVAGLVRESAGKCFGKAGSKGRLEDMAEQNFPAVVQRFLDRKGCLRPGEAHPVAAVLDRRRDGASIAEHASPRRG